MLSSEGRRRSRWSSFVPRFVTAIGLFAVPGCLLVQPLDDAKEDGDDSAGESGTGGSGATGGSRTTGGTGGSTGGKAGGTAGGTGGATGGSAGQGGAAGKGGAAGQGGAGPGGTSGASGSAGSGGTGNSPFAYGPVWTFDDDVQGWAVGYTEPSSLGLEAAAVHDAANGEPTDGSVAITIPFDGPNQTVEVGTDLPRVLDLTGERLAARVRLDSGFFSNDAVPGAVKLYVKTGEVLTYADGPWTPLVQGEWVTASLTMNAPDYDGGIDPTDVRTVGVAFKTDAGAESGWTTGTFHLDTVGWTNAERPPCILDPLLLDDMETPDGFGWLCQQDGRNGGWYVFDDLSGGTRMPSGSPVRFPLEELDSPRDDSTRAVHVSGSGFTAWGGGVGVSLIAGAVDVVSSWDISSYAGISFWARGTGTMWAQLSLSETRDANQDYPGTCEAALGFNCNDAYVGSAFALTDVWTEYVVPFAALKQEGWGHPAVWTYNLNAIEFRWGTDEAFDFWIDDVRLLERECNDDDIVDCNGDRCSRGTLVATDCDSECSGRGYATATCSPEGCLCSDPEEPTLADAIESICVCGAPSLDCSPEGVALLETQVTSGTAVDPILCYAAYANPTQMDCVTALATCWN